MTNKLEVSYFDFCFKDNGEVCWTDNSGPQTESYKIDYKNTTAEIEFSAFMQQVNHYYESKSDWDIYILIDNTGETLRYSTPTDLQKTTAMHRRYQLSDFYIGDAAQ